MKTLYLVRHAKAVPYEADLPDLERALNKRGRNDAQRMAKIVMRDGGPPEVLISSPAKRAIQTARIFAKAIGYPKSKVVLDEIIYDAADESSLLKSMQNIDDRFQSAMIFGHDPLMTSLANYLRKDFTETLPTCAVVCFDFRNTSWSKISKGRGILRFFDHPKREKELLDEMRTELKAKISEQLMQTVRDVHPGAAQEMKKAIDKSGRELTKKFLSTLASIKEKEQVQTGKGAA